MKRKFVGLSAAAALAFTLSACGEAYPASGPECQEVETGQVVDSSYCEDDLDGYEWADASEEAGDEEEDDSDSKKKKSKSKSKFKSSFKKK